MLRDGTDWIQVYSGGIFYPLAPKVEEVDMFDICHALSNLCRFAGHSREFYSVAQHSVLVSQNVPPEDALWGLLHDATEAYLTDMPRPLKRAPVFGELYLQYENKLMDVIIEKFGLSPTMPLSVKEADTILLMTEARDLLEKPPIPWSENPVKLLDSRIIPLPPVKAKKFFLDRYTELTKKC